MANKFKKLIALMSSLAIIASVMPAALAADTPDSDGVYYNEDFSGFTGTLANMEPGKNTNKTYSETNGLSFSTRSRAEGDYGQQYISVSNGSIKMAASKYVGATTDQPTITLDWTNGAEFVNDRVMSFDAQATAGTDIVITDSASKSVTISTPTAKWMTYNVISRTDDKTYILAFDRASGDFYSANVIDVVLADFATITSTKNKTFTYSIDNLKISDEAVDVPTVNYEDVNRIEVGHNEKIATVSASEFTVELSNAADFEYTIEGDEVYLSVKDTAASGAVTTVTIVATGSFSITAVSGEISALTAEDYINEVLDALVLSGMGVEKTGETEYTISSSFELPVSINDSVPVEWALSDTTYAVVEDGKLTLKKDEAMTGAQTTLTASASYGDAVNTKDFVLNFAYSKTDVFYDESFDEFATGTLVNLNSGNNSNSKYKASNGMTFTCGSRGDGGGDAIGVIIKDGTDGKYMTIANSNYTGQGRRPIVTLTRDINVSYNLVLKFKARFAAVDDELLITDNSSHTLTLTAPAEEYAGAWLDYTIIGSGTSSVGILIKDAEGKPVSYYIGSSPLVSVNTISVNDSNASTIDIDSLYIASDDEVISDADKVATGIAILDITDLKKSKDVYTATADFTLPAAPEGVTVAWTAMQKKADSTEWEESSFIKIAGTNAVIDPTADIDDYDVKLVATVSSGEVSDTKDFVIDLPNPMAEINGILAADFNIVNTTDTDAEGKTITFDLKGSDMLKRDLMLPIKYKAYKNSTVTWTSSDSDHVSIADDGTATVMTSDFDAHDVALTAVVTYKKGDITYSSEPQKFDIKMGFEESDAKSDDMTLGKYRVRYDAAYDANFSSIPTSASSDITLPATGHFGSGFIWSSSAPTVISNSGKFTKPSSSKTISMVASIISGSAAAEKTFTISVAGSNTSSGGGGGGGGSTSSTGTRNSGSGGGTIYTANTGAVANNNTSAADKVAQLQEEALASNDLFKDVSQAAWARDEINGLAKAGIINGKTDELFAPNDTITRAEFAKILMGAFGLASDAFTTSSFNDVSPDDWCFKYVESAYNLGIINGIGAGTFAPNALITRQDMAVMVARAAQVAGKDIAEAAEAKDFADAASIADYAKASVDTLVKGGIINGMSDTEFAPLANATRAQAAKILYKFL